MADVGAQVYRYLRTAPGLRLSPAQAAGFLGNTQQESSDNPNAPGGGLIQGQGGRTSHGTLQQQLASIRAELLGPERGTLQALRGVNDPRAAARLISQRFERPGIPMLSNRERYAEEALHRYGGLQAGPSFGGEGAPAGAPGSQGAEQSPAQVGDLVGLLAQLQGGQGASTSVAGLSLPKPTAEPQTGPRVPQELPQPERASPSALLALLSQLGEGGGEGSTSPAAPASAGGVEAGASYVNPLPGFTKGRTDQGVDYSARPGASIRAIGNGRVLGISPNWYEGQPYVYYQLTDGPQRGKVIYVAEQIAPTVKAGDTVRAGQTIGRYASHGTGIETGYGTHTGGVVATPYGGAPDGTETSGGKAARAFFEHLGAR